MNRLYEDLFEDSFKTHRLSEFDKVEEIEIKEQFNENLECIFKRKEIIVDTVEITQDENYEYNKTKINFKEV